MTVGEETGSTEPPEPEEVVAVAVAREVPEGTIEVHPLGKTAVVVPDQQIT